MNKYAHIFKGKKVTIMGLGLLGKGLGDAIFLAKAGAILTITDLKNEKELAPSLDKLKKYKNIKYVLGKHEISDFENCDFVLKAQGVPLNSPYIEHARKSKIPIRMDDELFISLLPKNVKVVGVTGTRGKTTVASLIFHILKSSGKKAHLGGNIRGLATLSLLPKIKSGDIVVLELSSWQLQGFHEQKISPNISVFTNFMDDHMNYYSSRKEYYYDKSAIYAYQKKGDICVVGSSLGSFTTKSKKIIAESNDVPKNWKLPLVGEHNLENISLSVAVVKALRIPIIKIKKGVESFKAVEGRLQLVKKIKGVGIYNDNNSTTPEATVAALKAFPNKNIILIMGGADKGLDTKELIKTILKYTKKVILLPGTGTETLPTLTRTVLASSLQDAVKKALEFAEKGDVILFSPAFASFGLFKNEYDRNDQFMNIIKKLK